MNILFLFVQICEETEINIHIADILERAVVINVIKLEDMMQDRDDGEEV